MKEKENCSLEDWLHRLLKTMTIQYPASTIVTTITQLLHQFSSTSFSIQDWNEPPVFSEDYTLFIQGIELVTMYTFHNICQIHNIFFKFYYCIFIQNELYYSLV